MNSKLENDKFLNEYLKIYQENPRSRVFAPLAEAYRKNNLIDEAIEICKEGLSYHSNFTSGLVAIARCYFDKRMYSKAIEELKKATSQAPDNYLAQKILAESYFKVKDYQNSIKTYKILNFLNPKNSNITNKISELEVLLKQVDKDKIEENKAKTNQDKASKKENYKIEKEDNSNFDEIPPLPYSDEDENYIEDNQFKVLKEVDDNIDYSFQEKPLSKIFTEEVDFNDESILKEFKTHTIAQLLVEQNDKEKAIEVYKNILKEDPNDEKAKVELKRLKDSIKKQGAKLEEKLREKTKESKKHTNKLSNNTNKNKKEDKKDDKNLKTKVNKKSEKTKQAKDKKEDRENIKKITKKDKIKKILIEDSKEDDNWLLPSKNKKVAALEKLINKLSKLN